jgi:hypothetical protein
MLRSSNPWTACLLENPKVTNHNIQLECLPEELLQIVISYLSTSALKNAALGSSVLNRHATNVLWQHVCLVDQWTFHEDDENPGTFAGERRGLAQTDEHDDTPIMRKLYILAT